MILGKFKIEGHSMNPQFFQGSEILVSSIPYFFSSPKVNDIVAFRYVNKVLVKRIKKLKSGHFLVQGDNLSDSLKVGWIKKDDIIGKVIYKL